MVYTLCYYILLIHFTKTAFENVFSSQYAHEKHFSYPFSNIKISLVIPLLNSVCSFEAYLLTETCESIWRDGM